MYQQTLWWIGKNRYGSDIAVIGRRDSDLWNVFNLTSSVGYRVGNDGFRYRGEASSDDIMDFPNDLDKVFYGDQKGKILHGEAVKNVLDECHKVAVSFLAEKPEISKGAMLCVENIKKKYELDKLPKAVVPVTEKRYAILLHKDNTSGYQRWIYVSQTGYKTVMRHKIKIFQSREEALRYCNDLSINPRKVVEYI